MANKIVRDISQYTASTCTLYECDDMTTPFDAADVGRAVVFRSGDVLHWGRIKTFVSASSVTLHPATTLPTGNRVLVGYAVWVLDQGEVHTYQDYLDRVSALVQDDVSRLTTDEVKTLLASAVTDYGQDKGFSVKVKVAGTGAATYSMATTFGSLWAWGTTYVKSVEYPFGDDPPTMLESSDFIPYDDGTAQDGSNIKLRFLNATPAVGEYFVAELAYQPRLPEVGGQNFPNTDEHFNNVTMLCAAYYCFALASSYALSTDSTIMADAVNYSDKMNKYLQLGREFLGRYNTNVFGSPTPTSAAAAGTVTMEIDTTASDGGSFVFH